MCTSWRTHNFSAFSLTNIRIQICTSRHSHDFFSSFYSNQHKFKSVPRTTPIIFLPHSVYFVPNLWFFSSSISNVYFGSTPWFFSHFLYDFIYIQIFTSCQTHDFSADFIFISSISNVYFGSTPWFFLPFPIWCDTNSNLYFVPNPWFFCWLTS